MSTALIEIPTVEFVPDSPVDWSVALDWFRDKHADPNRTDEETGDQSDGPDESEGDESDDQDTEQPAPDDIWSRSYGC